MGDLALLSATELLGQLRAGELSSRELLEHYLARVEEHNPDLNAVVTIDLAQARATADSCDAALRANGPIGPLHGLPMTVKDQFDTAGMRTTFGIRANARFVPGDDAVPVARLKAAGAVVFGKTNLPPLAADVQTYNRVFGTTNNPWDLSRTPGGSSGGSAVAMSAGLSGLELGSDLAGSIRIPAHYCGVYGHKPSFGTMSFPNGTSPHPRINRAEYDIAVPGPLARSADDLELALNVLAGPSPENSVAWRLDFPPARRASLVDYRVAAWLDDPACPTDPEVATPLRATVEVLRAAGVQVDMVGPELNLKAAFRNFQRLLYGLLSNSLPLARLWPLGLPFLFVPPVPGDNQLSRVLRYGAASHRDWILAHEAREEYREAWASFFERYDVLLCPVSPVAAISHNHHFGGAIIFRTMRGTGRRRRYVDQMVWPGVVGASYLPATVAPVGMTEGGLPVGVQIVGAYLEDRTTIDFARRLAGVIGGFEPPPGY
ncbi:MAG: amidase [Acidimicrobiales bacterium]